MVGFDDVQTAAFLGPALTTVRQPLQDMARAAVRMLIEALSTDDVIQPHIIMPTSLVVRNSTQQTRGLISGANLTGTTGGRTQRS